MFGRKKLNGKVIGANHIEGLPINTDSDLILKLTPENLLLIEVFTKQEFEIPMSKLTMIDNKNETEMKQIIKQSVPGMIIGSTTFGLLGAMVGGRVQTKEKEITKHFIIINYHSDNDKTIVLRTNDCNGAKELVDFYNKNKIVDLPKRVVL